MSTPIIFLHGWGASSQSFAGVRAFFESAARCIFVDFDCNPDKIMTLDDYSEYVEEILIREKITHCHIIAHSFGARVAVMLGVRNPHMIRRMVLTGAAGLKPRFNLKTWTRIRLYKTFGIGKGSSDYQKLSRTGKITFQNIIRRDLAYEIEWLGIPTLLIFGDKDKSTPLNMAKRWTKLQKQSILKIYKGAGHFAFIDRPVEFMNDARTFLHKEENCT